uniref:Pyridoxal phosphate homeostasis protein n=1 Tax=Plectus sambesii TaxID=2011161 RepID=A0A914WKN0_9BILA
MSSSTSADSTMSSAIADVKENVATVLQRITAAYERADPNRRASSMPRLVAVSKTKPLELVIACYEVGQRHFGENYVQELDDKANNEQINELCPDIKWHFIGTVQTNKIPKLASIPNLFCLETVGSEKMAKNLNKACEKESRSERLGVMVQVNTSAEEQKGGLTLDEAAELAQLIDKSCPALRFVGFMTIGSLEMSQAQDGSNPDFERLAQTRNKYCALTGAAPASVELSMGMSQDFETAIAQGSTNVRVGSTIFGPRIKRT